MTEFIYRKVVDGKEILLPELKTRVEYLFPNHQVVLDRILQKKKMKSWKVAIYPSNDERRGIGHLWRGLKMITLRVAVRDEMVIALLHEICHYLHPELEGNEIAIEKMALKQYGRDNSWFLDYLATHPIRKEVIMTEVEEKIARWLRVYKLNEVEVADTTEDGIVPWDKCSQEIKNRWLADAREILALIKEVG